LFVKMGYAWQDGLYSYSMDGQMVTTFNITGEVGEFKSMFEDQESKMMAQLKSGRFTDSDTRGLTLTGQEEYNFQLLREIGEGPEKQVYTLHGVVSEDGKKITMCNGHIIELMDEESVNKMKDEKDPADNPSNTYTVKPMGKIIWISGMSGMGKTTTAKLLQEKEGFVNYEGDCFLYGLNPYVGASKKGPTFFGVRPLSGIPEKRKEICRLALEEGYRKILEKKGEVDPKIWDDLYNILCDDILKEREKIGGNWVVGQAVYTKAARDLIRSRLGEDLIFIVLESGEEDLQLERLAKRYLGEGEVTEEAREETKKKLEQHAGGAEPVEEEEKNTFVIQVTKAQTPEDVVKKVLNFM